MFFLARGDGPRRKKETAMTTLLTLVTLARTKHAFRLTGAGVTPTVVAALMGYLGYVPEVPVESLTYDPTARFAPAPEVWLHLTNLGATGREGRLLRAETALRRVLRDHGLVAGELEVLGS
jgi:hypothetical protein